MTLKEWIIQMTPRKAAAALDVDENTVYQWKDLLYLPKPALMRRIVKRTSGLVTYEEIIEPFFSHKEEQH